MLSIASINVVHALDRALRQSARLGFLYLPTTPITKKKPRSPKVYYRTLAGYEPADAKYKRVKRELLDAGITPYGLVKSETRVLPKLLHPDEHIEAVIYGQHQSNSAMLVATNERIIYIDKKPMALFLDEVSYDVVSGIQFDIHLFFASIVLHTPVKNYNFRFVNLRCGENFARHIEKHRLEREPKDESPELEYLPSRNELRQSGINRELNDMAGYAWLPTDEEERQKLQLTV